MRTIRIGAGAGYSGDRIEPAVELAERDCAPGGTKTNLELAQRYGVRFSEAIPTALRLVLCDAQTSGGLLIAVSEEKAERMLNALAEAGVDQAAVVGAITAGAGVAVV